VEGVTVEGAADDDVGGPMMLVPSASGGEDDAVEGVAVVQAPMSNVSVAARPNNGRVLLILNVAP
jgi:hypothetical protein